MSRDRERLDTAVSSAKQYPLWMCKLDQVFDLSPNRSMGWVGNLCGVGFTNPHPSSHPSL